MSSPAKAKDGKRHGTLMSRRDEINAQLAELYRKQDVLMQQLALSDCPLDRVKAYKEEYAYLRALDAGRVTH